MYSLPHDSGLGLKPEHFATIIKDTPDIGWFEIHPENYMGEGGPMHKYLTQIRERYPLSMHSVGMSLGSADGIDVAHLTKLKKLIRRYQPEQVSEHLSWSHSNDVFLNDLLPLPYTEETFTVICDNIDYVQSFLNRRILIENPSTYIDFKTSSFTEPEFLAAVIKKTGCGALLDVNNIYVSAQNNNFDPVDYINNFPLDKVGEIHLAGHSVSTLTQDKKIRIDDHGSPVQAEVWQLFEYVLTCANTTFPVLIEWDTNIPQFNQLKKEADLARLLMNDTLGAVGKCQYC